MLNENKRNDAFKRFLFANIGALITFGAVLIQGGRVMAEIEHAAAIAVRVEQRQEAMQTSFANLRVDLAEVKGTVNAQQRQIETLQQQRRGSDAIHNRQQ